MIAGYLTFAEAARMARVSIRTLQRRIRDRALPLRHAKIGRRVVISERDLAQWIERHMVVVSPANAMHPVSRAILADLGTRSTPGRTTGATSTVKTATSKVRPSGWDNAAQKTTGVP